MKWYAAGCSLMFAVVAATVAAQPRTGADGWSKGATLRHPESLSGLWMADVHHRIFGLQIVLTTRARKSAKAPDGIIQTCDQANIEIFEQLGATRASGDGNWFDTNFPGTSWNGNHLKIDGPDPPGPEIHVDLRFDAAAETWTGRFHRGSLEETATLHRPRPGTGSAKSKFAGTWKHAGVANTCMHIAEGPAGELSAWSDDVVAPGTLKYGKGVSAPRDVPETYGFPAQVELHSAHNIFVRLKALSAVCCTIDVGGVLSADGERIRGNMPSEGGGNPRPDDWERVEGDSCLGDNP